MISLAAIKPQILDARITGHGKSVTIPFLPLSYVQWQNATIGLVLPQAPQHRFVPDSNKPPVDALDYMDMAYQRAVADYKNELALRRVAIALAGGGMEELQGKDLAEQVELIRDMDAGILNALYGLLEGMALKRSANWFPREQEQSSQNGHENLQGNEVVVATVVSTA